MRVENSKGIGLWFVGTGGTIWCLVWWRTAAPPQVLDRSSDRGRHRVATKVLGSLRKRLKCSEVTKCLGAERAWFIITSKGLEHLTLLTQPHLGTQPQLSPLKVAGGASLRAGLWVSAGCG